MTPFEIIILILIYLFCYGYVLAIFDKEENIWLRIFLMIVSFVMALYAPLFIASAVFEKLNNENNTLGEEKMISYDKEIEWLKKLREL